MKETTEARAVKIAANALREAGVCKRGSMSKCSRLFVDERTCNQCLAGWLLSQARQELEKETKR